MSGGPEGQPSFQEVFGVEPTTDNVKLAVEYLKDAMTDAALAQRRWGRGGEGFTYTSSPKSGEQEERLASERSLEMANYAVARLFPDGPVNGFYLRRPEVVKHGPITSAKYD